MSLEVKTNTTPEMVQDLINAQGAAYSIPFKAMQKIAHFIAQFSKSAAPVKSGKLRQSIGDETIKTENGAVGFITSNVNYFPFVILGTRPHQIVGSPLLVFKVAGKTIFTRSVNHPGTEPNDFIQDTIDEQENYISEIIQSEIEAANVQR